jgi:ribosome biogenesis protein Nip4
VIKPIRDFANLFGVDVNLNENLVVKKGDQYYLVTEDLKKTMAKGFLYVGSYLGRIANGVFSSGFEFLRMLSQKDANCIIVDEKTEWLFICGRDIFKRGITATKGSAKKGDLVVVLNKNNETLGYGRVACDYDVVKSGVAVKNLLDLGDFLRREKRS